MTMSSGTYTNPASEFVEAVGGHGCLLSNRSCCCILFGVYERIARLQADQKAIVDADEQIVR